MRALVFGGTFNPVHIGHLFIAEEARNSGGYDLVIFVPSNIPVHKVTAELIDPEHRIAMLRAAVADNSTFAVDDCEILRGGPSYMVDTLEVLPRTYGYEGKPGLLIGDDLAAGFRGWKDADKIAETADIIVARRSEQGEIPFPYPHGELENILIPLSSTEIRLRVREGKPHRYLVPEPVFRYIIEHGLYGAP